MALKEAAQDALAVQDACNLSGVAHSFLRAVQAVNAEVPHDTRTRNAHPVTQLFIYKLASLAGFEPLEWGCSEEYERAEAECKRLARGRGRMRYLTVTQEDIDKALSICCGSESLDYDIARDCPLGSALQREFRVSRREVRASPDFLQVGAAMGGTHYRANTSIRRFMRRFDKHRKAKPCRFRLEEY